MRANLLSAVARAFGQGGQPSAAGAGLPGSARQGLARRLGFLVVAVFLFVGFVLSATLGVQRSFLIQGESSSISVTFLGGDLAWWFPEATLCIPLPQPDPKGLDLPDLLCPSTIYSEEPASDLEFRWQQGEKVQVTVGEDGLVQIELLESTNASYPAGTLVVLGADQWRRNGALAFEGLVDMGEDIGPGSTHYLLSGRWEARQTSLATSLLRSITDVVKDGELARGTQATVYIDGRPASMAGHITPIQASPGSFAFVAISEAGRTELRLESFGLDAPVVIRPDWIDTAITSPVFLAAIVLLTLLGLSTQIYSDLTAQREPAHSDARTGAGPVPPPANPTVAPGPDPIDSDPLPPPPAPKAEA